MDNKQALFDMKLYYSGIVRRIWYLISMSFALSEATNEKKQILYPQLSYAMFYLLYLLKFLATVFQTLTNPTRRLT